MAVKSTTYPDAIQIGVWRMLPATGELVGPAGAQRLEPKVADLLLLLAAHAGQPVAREQIMDALWKGQVVGEDSLARAVFKLRQALGDDAKSPRYIETLSKRGYRLIVEPVPQLASPRVPDQTAVPGLRAGRWQSRRIAFASAMLSVAVAVAAVGAWWAEGRWLSPLRGNSGDINALTAQADDFYFQFSRGDNESAIELYERVLGLHPDDAHALAGLANALVQRSIRWPDLPVNQSVEFTRLRDALAHGHLERAPGSLQIARARGLAERAVVLAPESAAAHKAVGFVASAQGRFDSALLSYERAVAIDPEAWGPLINIGDVLEITGRNREALPYYERAYSAMERGYVRNPVQIRPWRAQLGALIAARHAGQDDQTTAAAWYRRVLVHSPLHPEATRGIARLLLAGGDEAQARRLCAELTSRVGESVSCEIDALVEHRL